MAIFMVVYVVVVFAAVISIFAYTIKKGKERLPEEEGKQPIYEKFCGGFFGTFWIRGPFIRLSVYEDFIVVRKVKAGILKYGEFETEIKKKLLYRVMAIKHKNENIPKRIELSMDTSELEKIHKVLETKNEHVTKGG